MSDPERAPGEGLKGGYRNRPMSRAVALDIAIRIGELMSDHNWRGKALSGTTRVTLKPSGLGYDVVIPAEHVQRLADLGRNQLILALGVPTPTEGPRLVMLALVLLFAATLVCIVQRMRHAVWQLRREIDATNERIDQFRSAFYERGGYFHRKLDVAQTETARAHARLEGAHSRIDQLDEDADIAEARITATNLRTSRLEEHVPHIYEGAANAASAHRRLDIVHDGLRKAANG